MSLDQNLKAVPRWLLPHCPMEDQELSPSLSPQTGHLRTRVHVQMIFLPLLRPCSLHVSHPRAAIRHQSPYDVCICCYSSDANRLAGVIPLLAELSLSNTIDMNGHIDFGQKRTKRYRCSFNSTGKEQGQHFRTSE